MATDCVLIAYFELGPGAFEEVHGWPLIAS